MSSFSSTYIAMVFGDGHMDLWIEEPVVEAKMPYS